ncbi:MAG TPA: 3-hydroxyacyl-CoA dehydrogenase NAD-binding domain-containing protein [Candidatus Polarisedimenticolaceae bacterium]|nr:3-hydroxyacyl-CoA dehydrogenase NAD-binding domain-containing protein [Candidatus Polarisedimenticolaceae bacterium]
MATVLGVVGAGNMGSGIAQKMASEGFTVILVDLDEEKVARGVASIRKTLAEGVERRIFKPADAEAIQARVIGTADWEKLRQADAVVEAVFEDLRVKQEVFARLSSVCRPDALLASNTSSFAVADLASVSKNPERVLGLHYFYHPAKNRLVEVVPTALTDPAAVKRAWLLQERMGKTPIHSADQQGFVVNRYFVPWLNEAVRLLESGAADIPTIEAACKAAFGVGMGPFELMNVTGIPIALHAATTLGEAFGPFYAPSPRLREQVTAGTPWPLDGAPDPTQFEAVADRMWAVVFMVAAALVDQEVGSVEDVDIGARVGLRWPRGPFETMNRMGVDRARELVATLSHGWNMVVPAILRDHAKEKRNFAFRLVRTRIEDGIATLTVDRPDAMNALNETVVAQLTRAFRAANDDPEVRGIVIAGTGKAFIAGADIRFFVDNIEKGDMDRIVSFTQAGHDLLRMIDQCPKPVVARMHGLALGGGLELALACDRIVATPKAALAFPETGIGIYPGLGGTQRAPRRVGPGLAKWLIYTGQMLSAEEARAIGLVDAVVPFEELDAAVVEAMRAGKVARPALSAKHAALEAFFAGHAVDELLAGASADDEPVAKASARVKQKAPIALRLAEQLIDLSGSKPLEDGLAEELRHLVEIFSTEDAKVGLSSIGKRAPVFAGR